MFAASRPDESISGDAVRKEGEEEERKKKLSGEWFPVEEKKTFCWRKNRNLLCNFFFFRFELFKIFSSSELKRVKRFSKLWCVKHDNSDNRRKKKA